LPKRRVRDRARRAAQTVELFSELLSTI
jgi:hypothetical protein